MTYSTSDAFNAFLGERTLSNVAERSLLEEKRKADMAEALAPSSLSTQQGIGMALLGALPILIGLAARGRRGGAIGGMTGAQGVGLYAKGLEDEREKAAKRKLLEVETTDDLLKESRAEEAALEKLRGGYLKERALYPDKMQYLKEIASYKEGLKPRDTFGMPGEGPPSPAGPSTLPESGAGLEAEGEPPAAGPASFETPEGPDDLIVPTIGTKAHLAIQNEGRKLYGEDFNIDTAKMSQVKNIWASNYQKVRASAGEEAAAPYKPEVLKARLDQLIVEARNTLSDPALTPVASLYKEGKTASGMPNPTKWSEAMDLVKTGLAAKKQAGIDRPISETQATQLATNLSMRADMDLMIQLVDKMGEGGFERLKQITTKLSGDPRFAAERASSFKRAAKGGGELLSSLGWLGAPIDEVVKFFNVEVGSPEYEFLKMGNVLATKYAALYNGKRLSDMDFKIFKELVGSEDFRYASKDALKKHLGLINRSAMNSFRDQYNSWRAAGWRLRPLAELPDPSPENRKWIEENFPVLWKQKMMGAAPIRGT